MLILKYTNSINLKSYNLKTIIEIKSVEDDNDKGTNCNKNNIF